MKPRLCSLVVYTIGSGDAEQVNRRRADGDAIGNQVRAGDEYPAIVVRDFNEASGTVNLKVLLDGNDDYWATSRVRGTGYGEWHWPPNPEREPGDRPQRF